MLPLAIPILGLPGSGKSSLAAALAGRLDGDHLMASTVLREHLESTPEVAARWRSYWERGRNAPDTEVLPVLWAAFAASRRDLVVLDGYPRTADQWDDFHTRGGRLAFSVLLDIPAEVAMSRALTRLDATRVQAETAELLRRRIAHEAVQINGLLRVPAIGGNLVRIDSAATSTPEMLAWLVPRVDAAVSDRRSAD